MKRNNSSIVRTGQLNKTGENQIGFHLNLNNKQKYSFANLRINSSIIKANQKFQENKLICFNQTNQFPSKFSEAINKIENDKKYQRQLLPLSFQYTNKFKSLRRVNNNLIQETPSKITENKDTKEIDKNSNQNLNSIIQSPSTQEETPIENNNQIQEIPQKIPEDNVVKEIQRNSKLFKILKECEATGGLICDEDFRAHVDSITLDKSHKNYYSHFAPAKWLRPTELFKTSIDNIKLFDYIAPSHIKQGFLGNCYFLAALSALSQIPYLVEQIFINSSANKYGLYSLIFYRQGIPVEVVIDDRIPCRDDRPLFAKPVGNELWVMLLEKAWAKFFGSYIAIESGLSYEPMEAITGQPSFTFNLKDEEFKDLNKLGEKLFILDQKSYLLCAGTKEAKYGEKEEKSAMGIVTGHAYTMIAVYNIKSTKLLKMYNPWGELEWKGKYSDTSNKWTEQLKQQINYQKIDGQFYMDLKEFQREFEQVSVNCIKKNYQYSYTKNYFRKHHAKYYLFSVNQTQNVCFRVHQVSERTGKTKDRSYKYAGIELQVFRYNDTKVWSVATGSKHQYFGNRSVFGSDDIYQVYQTGDYCLRCKVFWEDDSIYKNNEIVISSYSQEKITLTLDQNQKGKQILDTFYKQIALKEAKPIDDWNCNCGQAEFVSRKIIVLENNNEKKCTLTTTIDLSGSKNIKFGKQNRKNKLFSEIIAQEQSVYFLVIKPTNRTNYALKQSIKYSFKS